MLPAFRRWALTILKPHEYAEGCFQARCHGIRNEPESESEHSISLLLRKSICIFTPAMIRWIHSQHKSTEPKLCDSKSRDKFPLHVISSNWNFSSMNILHMIAFISTAEKKLERGMRWDIHCENGNAFIDSVTWTVCRLNGTNESLLPRRHESCVHVRSKAHGKALKIPKLMPLSPRHNLSMMHGESDSWKVYVNSNYLDYCTDPWHLSAEEGE